MYCKKCGKEVADGYKVCPYCGTPVGVEVKQEKASVGLAILSFFIPLVGLIMFLVKKDDSPKTAKACGICALVSAILSIVLSFGIFAMTISFTDKVIDKVTESEVSEEKDVVDDFVIDTSEDVEDSKSTEKPDEKEDKVDSSDVTVMNNEWSKYEISVGNKTIKLPCSYNDLINAYGGVEMKSVQAKSYLEDGYYTLADIVRGDDTCFFIEVLNDTGSDKLYTDCLVTRVSQNKYQVDRGEEKIIFPGNFYAGKKATTGDLEKVFGMPTNTHKYEDGDYYSYTWTWSEDETWTTYNRYEICVINGVIDSISLDHRGYK